MVQSDTVNSSPAEKSNSSSHHSHSFHQNTINYSLSDVGAMEKAEGAVGRGSNVTNSHDIRDAVFGLRDLNFSSKKRRDTSTWNKVQSTVGVTTTCLPKEQRNPEIELRGLFLVYQV